MLNPTFLENKIKRQINQNGQKFVFLRYSEDEYHQISDEATSEFEIKGLFHTTNIYITMNTNDGSRASSKPQPMILTTFDQGENVKIDDEVIISDKTYVVIGKTNFNSFNIAYDISLRLKDLENEDQI